MKSVFTEIEQWANKLPYWEQAALDKVMSGKTLGDKDYQELLKILLEDNHLAEKSNDRKAPRFQKEIFENRDEKQPVVLKEIFDLKNVNALVPNQRLTFGYQLTAIFGRNGSGKSGYARVLGSAGFTRGDREVLPNVDKSLDKNRSVKATLKIDVEGREKTVSHETDNPCSDLTSLYVFDSTSVKVHMTGKNAFSFSPAGLSVLTELSRVTDEVRNLLNARINKLERSSEFADYFFGDSEIRELIENLDAQTDIDYVKSLAQVNAQDERHIHELDVEIGNIGLGRHKKLVKQKKQELDVLHLLYSWIAEAQKRLDLKVISSTNKRILQYLELTTRAEELSAESFRHERFSQTGNDLWHKFVQTAHQLAQAESKDEGQYPREKDFCLLCQQPLSQDARELILQLWLYLAGKVRSDLSRIEGELDRAREEIEDTEQFVLSDNFATSIALLAKTKPTLATCAERQVKAYSQFERDLLAAIESLEIMESSTALPKDCSQEIDPVIKQLEIGILELEEQDLDTRFKELEDERRLIEHRKKLKELLPKIEAYVKQRIWARKASKIGGSTHHITREYNKLFEQLVKNNYIDIFETTLNKLGRPIQVEIVTSGRKGSTVKQIQLKAHKTAKDIADPEKVLSEGEKRAVALADFLTEAALDTTCSGIVLDDPVTSLDLEWRKAVAIILAGEAIKRQVIVFTHDLPFLYLLLEYAKDQQVDKNVHWIKRGEIDDRPGYVHIDNCPALEQKYKSSEKARDLYALGKKTNTAEEQLSLIREGMAALRTSYEALVVYEYFGGVVQRFDERISLGRLPSLVWDDRVSNEINVNYGRLSRYIEGHLHSDALAEPLTLKMLRDECDVFDGLRNKIKGLKKKKEKA